MIVLEDGVYDVMIIDGRESSDLDLHLEVAVSSGAHRGDVVAIVMKHASRSLNDVLGTPATLTVIDGRPRLNF